jgi:hypothetical protein
MKLASLKSISVVPFKSDLNGHLQPLGFSTLLTAVAALAAVALMGVLVHLVMWKAYSTGASRLPAPRMNLESPSTTGSAPNAEPSENGRSEPAKSDSGKSAPAPRSSRHHRTMLA